jgi:hypothetical protein
MILDDIRRTSDNKLAGSIRILLAVLFLMTGGMKLLIPTLAEAWSGQLLAANIPLTPSRDGLCPSLRWHWVLFSPSGYSSVQRP